ncbi:MAG: glycosyltransferase [Mycobacteriales bacterium]
MSIPIRIAMVAFAASPLPPAAGGQPPGQSMQVVALSRAMAALGHDVTIYSRLDNPAAPGCLPLAHGVELRQLPAGGAAPIAAGDLVPLVAEFGHGLSDAFAADTPDLIHAHSWTSGLAALQATRDRSVPLVQTFHGLGAVQPQPVRADESNMAQRVRMEAVIGRAAARVVASCDDESQGLRRMGVSWRRINIIPPGIDLDTFYPSATDAAPSTVPRLLTVGTLAEPGGMADQIRALAKLPGAHLTIAGGPPAAELAEDPDARRLLGLAHALGVARRVDFVGFVPRSRIAELLRTVDMLLCTPWAPTFGVVALEAMASGVPVIATAVGGMRDTVVPGVTGELIAPRAPTELAHAIRRLFHDPVRLQAYRFAAVDRARSAFSWERAAVSTEMIYRQILGIPESPTAVSQPPSQVAS